MGNSSTKEARQPHPFSEQASSHAAEVRDAGSRPRGRAVRTDLGGLLGIATNAPGNGAAPLERRETRQEREARRLERERQARLMERERSMREEHVDGGYLVTLGTYVGTEDFNKAVVRQLQIERRLAPFWRGLQDFSDTWTEYQLAAAARGLEVPPPDQPPPEGFFSRPTSAPSDPSTKHAPGHHTLTVPPGDKPGGSGAGSGAGLAPAAAALSTSIPTSASASPSVPVGSLAGTSSPAALSVPTTPTTARASTSPFKPRAKALAAALSVSSRNGSSTDIAPREIQLPHDPFVNGQPIEVFLYKNADECPICFLSYPPYLNHTRCCGQAICSECFVQIKRTEPHYPEGHGDTPGAPPATDLQPEEQAGQLISEPACCPYCQQADFGVTYDPPPFRRGLVHSSSMSSSGLGGMGAAMSSSSSVNSAVSPTSLTSPNNPNLLSANSAGGTSTPTSRRRTQSLSATAPNVVTTDRVRPDWATKLAAQRAHIARRAAAATALHTAAFLMGAQENRPFRVGRFSRRNTSNTNNSNNNSNNNNSSSNDGDSGPVLGAADSADSPASVEPGPRSSSAPFAVGADGNSRRTRMEDLEELMFREALRQSLATEEERRRKEEKEARKEAKRREKEERKAAKAALKQQRQQGSSPALYGAATGTDSGTSSASASSLSLSGLGIGNRRRGNSAASTNLRVEASVAHAMAVSGGGGSGGAGGAGPGTNSSGNGASSSASSTANPIAGSSKNSAVGNGNGNGNNNGNGNASANSSTQAGSNKGKAVDRGLTSTPETDMETDAGPSTASSSAPRLIPSPQPSAGPSHLRQMSNASSVSSSLPDSTPGSYQNMAMHLHDPRASGLSLGSRSATSEDGDHGDDRDPSTSTEPMFNFSSLAEIVGVQLEGRHAGRRLSAIGLDEDDTTTSSGAKADAAPTDEAPAVGPTPPKQGSEAFPTVDEHLEHAEPEDASKPSAPAVTSTAEFKQPPQVMVTPGTPAPTSGFE